MKLLTKVTAIFDRTISLLAFLAAILLILIMLSVSAEVFMRQSLARPLVGVLEITEISLLFITFLGAAWLLKRDGHVKMDLVINRLGPRTQVVVNIIMSILAAITCLVIVWYSAEVTWDHFQRGLIRPGFLEVPNVYVLPVIPLGIFLLFVQFLRRIYGYLRSWKALSN